MQHPHQLPVFIQRITIMLWHTKNQFQHTSKSECHSIILLYIIFSSTLKNLLEIGLSYHININLVHTEVIVFWCILRVNKKLTNKHRHRLLNPKYSCWFCSGPWNCFVPIPNGSWLWLDMLLLIDGSLLTLGLSHSCWLIICYCQMVHVTGPSPLDFSIFGVLVRCIGFAHSTWFLILG